MNVNHKVVTPAPPLQLVVVGAGYVGLVTAACMAELGHKVVCVDVDHGKIASLQKGVIPIFEPGLKELVARNESIGRLVFSTSASDYLAAADAVFVAVGTPPRPDGEGADLTYLMTACRTLAAQEKNVAIIVKSTVPPGTCDAVEEAMRTASPGSRITVASNPEFLREGNAIADFMRPDRIVCGVEDDETRDLLLRIYQPLLSEGVSLLFVKRRAAELVKHASNAFLAIKISFINEVADLCEAIGADVTEVSRGVGLDSRIGPQFLTAGPGYGGSCFPKDAAALLAVAGENGVQMRCVEGAVGSNSQRKKAMARRVVAAMGGSVRGRTIAVLGLAFKANTDDIRESPATALITALQNRGAKVRAYDPQAQTEARRHLYDVFFAQDAYECVEGADCVVLATEWQQFRDLDIGLLAESVGRRLFIDLRNHMQTQALTSAGFEVHGIGRASVRPSYPAKGFPSRRDRPEIYTAAGGGLQPANLNGAGHAG